MVDDGRQENVLREFCGDENNAHIGYNYLAIHHKSVNLLKNKG